MDGPDESLQAIDVDDRVPDEERVTSAEDGSFLYLSLMGAWIWRSVAVMWFPFAEAISYYAIDLVYRNYLYNTNS